MRLDDFYDVSIGVLHERRDLDSLRICQYGSETEIVILKASGLVTMCTDNRRTVSCATLRAAIDKILQGLPMEDYIVADYSISQVNDHAHVIVQLEYDEFEEE